MEINGKIYRNLEGQVGYLTEKYGDLQDQINDIKGKLTHYIIVEELPTEDIDTSAVYLVGPKGTEPNTYYEEWVYVQLEDESWTWEKLGDTDSVDLSGYLEKQTGATTYAQLYQKNPDGTQSTVSVSNLDVGNAVALRNSQGQLNVAAPTGNQNATNKKYVEDNFLAKQTGTTTSAQLYRKNADGTQGMVNMAVGSEGNSVVQRNGTGQINCADPSANSHTVNKSYCDNTYLAKKTVTSSASQVYAKRYDGAQEMYDIQIPATAFSIPFRAADGQLNAPNQTVYIPSNDQFVSKRYVDAVVGQLLYLHDIELVITVDSTNKLFIKGYLINGSATAITTFDRIVYKRLDVQWGGFGPSSDNAVPAAITKMPDNFRQDDFDEPLVGFLYQYFSGGNLVSGTTTSIMITTITDVVTTW